MIRRILPHPWLAAALGLLWLLLANSISLGNVLLAIVLGIGIGLAVRSIWPPMPRIRAPLKAFAYVWLVLGDILVANFQVARLVLGPIARLRPRIVTIALDVDDPVVAALLAATVTLTPGTVSVDLDVDARRLVVHALDAPDDRSVIDPIKTRYEARLKEIFRC